MRVFRFNDHEGEGGLIVKTAAQLNDELEACEPGDGPFTIYVEEMDEAAVDALSEWDGF